MLISAGMNYFTIQRSSQQMFCRKRVLRNFAKFTGKHLRHGQKSGTKRLILMQYKVFFKTTPNTIDQLTSKLCSWGSLTNNNMPFCK